MCGGGNYRRTLNALNDVRRQVDVAVRRFFPARVRPASRRRRGPTDVGLSFGSSSARRSRFTRAHGPCGRHLMSWPGSETIIASTRAAGAAARLASAADE